MITKKTKRIFCLLLALVFVFQLMLLVSSAEDRSDEIESNKVVVLTNIYPEDSIALFNSMGYADAKQLYDWCWIYFITLETEGAQAVQAAIAKLSESKNVVYAGPVHTKAPYDYLGTFPLFDLEGLSVKPKNLETFNPETDFAQFGIKSYDYLNSIGWYCVRIEHGSEENIIHTLAAMSASSLFSDCEYDFYFPIEGPQIELAYHYDVSDAVSAFQYLAGKAELEPDMLRAYDYNKDGAVTLTDCLKLFRLVSGK